MVPQENFYALREGKESQFIAWLKERVLSVRYFKPPQYKDAKELIEHFKGDDLAVYMELCEKYKEIG